MMRSITYENCRNIDRFPADFMFQLSNQETNDLLSQNVIPSQRSLGGFLPYAFTDQGVDVGRRRQIDQVVVAGLVANRYRLTGLLRQCGPAILRAFETHKIL
jgi:hypothetical protein